MAVRNVCCWRPFRGPLALRQAVVTNTAAKGLPADGARGKAGDGDEQGVRWRLTWRVKQEPAKEDENTSPKKA